jgi:hypothetical protein
MAKKILTKEEVRERNRELAKERMLERKKKDMKSFKTLQHLKKLSAYELGVYREAAEEYYDKLRQFNGGIVVKGKGKDKTQVVVPHIPEPSFKKIYKAKAKAAGLYRKTVSA